MKKQLKFVIIILLLAIACVLFPMPSYFNRINKVDAASIVNVSGKKITLTGFVNSKPRHYFVDDSENSTLVNATYKDCGGEYYSIVNDGSQPASGSSTYHASMDMEPFIANGLLYAQATAKVTVNKNTNLKITLSAGESSCEVQSEFDDGGSCLLVSPLLPITNINDDIEFRFSTLQDGKVQFQMDEPTIYIHTEINSITLDQADQEVSPGQTLKINAYNDITHLTGQSSGNFMYYAKKHHQINYEFVSGEDYVKIIGDSFVIKDDAPIGETIVFRVYSNKNTYSQEIIQSSNYVTLTITDGIRVQVHSDFKNPAVFTGEGVYTENRYITLSVMPNKGYNFLGWYVNGSEEPVSTEPTLLTRIHRGDYIFAKFTKEITITGLEVRNRIYDGKTEINSDNIKVLFADGDVEEGHEVGLKNVTYSFADANVGKGKTIIVTGDDIALDGKNSDIYVVKGLDSLKTNAIPISYGEIIKRDTIVTPNKTQKQYGDVDPELSFVASNLADGQSRLEGHLQREQGEEIGTYAFTIGDLVESNPNYNIIFNNIELFEITQRVLRLEGLNVNEKIYDGNSNATISARLANIYNGEDVSASISGRFVTSNAGFSVEAYVTNIELSGADKDNYTIQDYALPIYGDILKRQLTVTAIDSVRMYGEKLNLDYKVDGLLSFDNLTGELAVDNYHVGTRQILLGSLNNPNYQISFVGANCEIVKRPVYVTADSKSKTYGDDDPELSYSVSNLVNGDSLTGKLTRVAGEDAALYSILQGDVSNPDYEVVFTGNLFEIVKREITVDIQFLDKQYDGTAHADYTVSYTNNIKNVDFKLQLDANLTNLNCGNSSVKVVRCGVLGEDKNYTFVYNYKNTEIVVSKRDVVITVDYLSKFYGSPDPDITYTVKNIVAGEQLVGEIGREEGENVGNFAYYLDTLNNQTNPNYNITLTSGYFEIKPKRLHIQIPHKEKYFGDAEPETFDYNLLTELAFNEKQQDVFTGYISRQSGEYVGVYPYDLSTLSVGDNYVLVLDDDQNFIINKRPVNVICRDATKVYGDDDPEFKYDVEGEVENEKLYVQIRRSEYSEDVGSYELICTTTNDSRYTISFVPANLTISPAPISIKVYDDIEKVYGNADPTFDFIITSGYLKNNDRLEDIITGEMKRDEGETIGFYDIEQGSFSLGKNYDLTFEAGKMEIKKKEVTIYALSASKNYGDSDPELKYSFSCDELPFGDTASGKLVRAEGESVGSYLIDNQLTLNENYIVSYVANSLVITPREIEIVPNNLSKQYGYLDGELTFDVGEQLVGEDSLTISLSRVAGEEVGKYKMSCYVPSNPTNDNYSIIFGDYYFTILPREIVVEADGPIAIHYGDPEPELTYHIKSGELLDGDTIKGEIYRESGNNVRVYNIISALTINKNYRITFIASTVEILPLEITIASKDYTKIYGQNDPKFDYQIISEQKLINGDVLYGNITRMLGDDVGEYPLVCGVYHPNYSVTMLDAKLTIAKKDAYLITTIFDKVYDGTTRAILRNPYVSGLIDNDVSLMYDSENCAEFASSQVGTNIGVKLHDITLAGSKAENYNLIIPVGLSANITNKQIASNGVVLSTNKANLYEDYSLNVTTSNLSSRTFKMKNQQSCMLLDIWVENGDEQVDLNGQFSITLKLSDKIYNSSNIYVYQRMADGEVQLISSRKVENGSLLISSSQLGEFYITTSNDSWIDYSTYVSSAIIIVAICLIGVAIFKHKKKSGKN